MSVKNAPDLASATQDLASATSYFDPEVTAPPDLASVPPSFDPEVTAPPDPTDVIGPVSADPLSGSPPPSSLRIVAAAIWIAAAAVSIAANAVRHKTPSGSRPRTGPPPPTCGARTQCRRRKKSAQVGDAAATACLMRGIWTSGGNVGLRRCAVRRDARSRCVDGGRVPKPCCACLPVRMFASSRELDLVGVDFDATELGLPGDQAPPRTRGMCQIQYTIYTNMVVNVRTRLRHQHVP